MANPFLGEIRLLACNFAPRGWAFCQGQLLPISEHEALFSLIGTVYGGDGESTFAMPDLRGRVPVHQGNGVVLGEIGGTYEVTLTSDHVPPHTHPVYAHLGTRLPEGAKPSGSLVPGDIYTTEPNATLNAAAISPGPPAQPHSNVQPYLAMNYCIALEGIYPNNGNVTA